MEIDSKNNFFNLENERLNNNFKQKVELVKNVNTKALFKMNSKNFSALKNRELSKNFEDILLSCKFNEVENCNMDDFKWTLDRDFGKIIYKK